MKKCKKIVAIALAFVMMVSEASIISAYSEVGSFETKLVAESKQILDEEVMRKYVEAVNEDSYENIAQLFSENGAESLQNFFQSANCKISHQGIYNVKCVNEYLMVETENEEYDYDTTLDVVSYLVYMDCDVFESNQYYKEGANFFKLVMGTENAQRVILEFSVASNQLVEIECNNSVDVSEMVEYEAYVQERAQMLEELEEFELKNVWQEENQNSISTFATYKPKTVTSYTFPTTIRVKKSSDEKVYEIDFRDYCNVVLASEFGVGTDGKSYPHTEAIKAMCLCVRNFGWYRSLYPYNATEGYDVTDDSNTQNYKWSIAGNVESEYSRHVQIMEEMWDVMMFDGNKKLFIPAYLAGKYNDKKTTKETSLVYQNGANYLAHEKGYSYKQILTYYYEADELQISASPIIICEVHIKKEYYTTAHQHGQECETCGHIIMSSHLWVKTGSKYRCKTCGYIAVAIPSIKI